MLEKVKNNRTKSKYLDDKTSLFIAASAGFGVN